MLKKIVLGALLGWMVMIAWIFLSNGIMGIRSDIDMNRLLNEDWVYEILKESIREPGGYSVNPSMESPSGPFPPDEPVFSIHYSGLDHGDAGHLMLVNLALALASQILAAWMLSLAARRILTRYWRRVLFLVGIGLLFALFGDMMRYGIGGYSLQHSLILAAQNLAGWSLAGLAIAGCVKAETEKRPTT